MKNILISLTVMVVRAERQLNEFLALSLGRSKFFT